MSLWIPKNPFKNFGEAGVSQNKNKTKQNTATFCWCFHGKSCHVPLPCTHQSTEGQFIYKSSSQSPRMSLTKEATSVSLDSCRVKKGCCWGRKERTNRKVYYSRRQGPSLKPFQATFRTAQILLLGIVMLGFLCFAAEASQGARGAVL